MDPCILITVAHPVRNVDERVIRAPNTFYVRFHGNQVDYRVQVLKCSLKGDLMIMRCYCPATVSPAVFTFVDHPVRSSTSFVSISHVNQRDWRTLYGRICSDPFEIGQHSYYSPNLLIFDHDAQLVPEASGTLLIDMAGRVIGMQITQLSVKEHAYCVRDADRQRRTNDYIGVDQMGRQIKEYTFVECNLKQAVTVQSVQATVKNLFQEEGVDPNTNLNNYLRESVVKYLMKGARQGHATKPSVLSQAPSAEKRPRTS